MLATRDHEEVRFQFEAIFEAIKRLDELGVKMQENSTKLVPKNKQSARAAHTIWRKIAQPGREVAYRFFCAIRITKPNRRNGQQRPTR